MRLNGFRADTFSFSSSTNRNWRVGRVVLLIGCCVGFSTYSVAQQAASLQQTPLAVKNGTAQLIGHYDSQQMLRLVVALKPPHLEEEEQFLNQLQDRDSPLFYKYLSEQEWNERFAPSAQDEQAVVAWAQSQSLTITQRYPNRLLVDVEAPVAIIEKALNVTINRYQLGTASYYSNDRDPVVPAQLLGTIHAVLGLNNLEAMHAASRNIQATSGPDYSPGPAYSVGSHLQRDGDRSKLGTKMKARKRGTGPEYSYNGYDPTDLYSSTAYDYAALQKLGHCCNPLNNPGNSPPEASIAIAIWGDFSAADLNGFLTIYPYLAQNVQTYHVDGMPPCCNPETTLDMEWATAMSNSFSSSASTAEVHVYEGANNQDSTLLDVVNQILTDGHARVLSMSWGNAEVVTGGPGMDSYHAVFNQMIGQGWTLVAASGDGGATDDCADHLSVSYPASDPDVTAAGGTQLFTNQSYFENEQGWSGGPYGCANNDGGSGGGCSAYFGIPGYQNGSACAGSRSVPDLALNADGVFTAQNFFYNGSIQPTGGTSIVAPEIAGFYAQENAYLLYIQSIVGNTCGSSLSSPCAPLGNANWYLYYEGLHAPVAPHYPFYDITSGCNNNDITQQYGLTPFCAGPGYDLVTGWGSANMLQLAWMMNTFIAGDAGGPSISFTGPLLNHWYTTDQTIGWTVTDTSGGGHPPNGVAGFSSAWDSDPGDPYSEPTPGGGFPWDSTSFYSGPQSPNATDGSVTLSSNPNGQGCHTLNVRAWDNAGQPSDNATYGPVCYDTYPPQTYASLSGYSEGQDFAGPVLVTLTAYDYSSGVGSTVYQINGSGWQSYSGPFYVTVPGTYMVSFYSTDVAGNVENTEQVDFIIVGNWQYLLSVSKSGTGSGTVTSADGYINCGATCSYNYYDETPVTLTATAAAGSVFAGWTGCDLSLGSSCTLSVTAARNVTAVFNIPVALQYIPVTPCRLVDTRLVFGGSGPIPGMTSRDFPVPQEGNCDIPATAAAYSLNVTAVPQGPLGFLTAWPTGQTRPTASTLNSYDGRVKATAAILPAGASGAVSVYVTNTTDVLLDIDGYFVPPTDNTLAFYPLAPCRLADTRPQFGGDGPIPGGSSHDFPILNVPGCSVPPTAQAYSLNVTAVPTGALYVLTTWPTGDPMPNVSTLNDYTGTVVANAAIVGAGTNGKVSIYASNNTNVVIDIDGYFAPPSAGGLSLYTMPPCRVIDTRKIGDRQPFSGTLVPPVDVEHSLCAPTSEAQAYVLNATVVPAVPLGFLTLWPNHEPEPRASTLNAWDGIVASNMAIVPTNDGTINADASNLTQLVLDIAAYFAP
ncbi:MAG: protease pro-enzyme activation domain-containing protein [Candidatus Korobacteraceae bacterium]